MSGRWVALLFLVDLCLVTVSFYVAYHVRFEGPFLDPSHVEHMWDHRILGFAALCIWPAALYVFGLYDPARFHGTNALLSRILPACALTMTLTAALLFVFKADLASRLVFGVYFGLSTGLVWAVRASTGLVLTHGAGSRRILIVGSGTLAARVGVAVEAHDGRSGTLLGYVHAGEQTLVPPARLLGDLEALPELLEREVVDLVVVATDQAHLGSLAEAMGCCADMGIDVVVVPAFLPSFMAHAVAGRLFGEVAFHLDGSPQFRGIMNGKRAFDLAGAVILIAVTLPLMFVAALLIRLTSQGPVLFVQERVGLNGRGFRLYKLRTMVEGAEHIRAELSHANEQTGPVFKLERDPRVTSVGRVLRRFSVDELPQLVNVIKGDMSLVGPRPPLPNEVSAYTRPQWRRMSVRPGMTCTWQVSGRSDVDFNQWVEMDLAYIDDWSPWLDLAILIRTVPAVLLGRGAR